MVPPIVLALAKHPLVDKYDLRQPAHLFSGAAPLGAELAAAAAGAPGLPRPAGLRADRDLPGDARHARGQRVRDAAASGQPMPNTECKIVDVATGAELGPSQEGEICMRGPQVMKGYLNRPEATAAMIDARGLAAHGRHRATPTTTAASSSSTA